MWALGPAFAADPLLVSKSYWVDHSGTANLSNVRSTPFQPLHGTVSEGYSAAAIWIKLSLSGQTQSEPLGLLVRPAFLRSIELYDPAIPPPSEGAPSLISGRDAPMEPNNHIGIDNGFVIWTSTEPRDIYIRVSSTTAVIVEIDLQILKTAESNSRIIAAALAVYVAFLLSFCLWGLVSWGVRRDTLYGLFSLRQFYSLLHIFIFYGLVRYFFSEDLEPSTRDAFYNYITVTIIAVAAFFDVRLISEFSPSRILLTLSRFAMTLPAISLFVLFSGHPQKALFINSIVVVLIMCTNLALAFSTRNDRDTPYDRAALIALRVGFSAMTMIVILPQLMFQNILDPSLVMLKMLFSHAVISTIMLFVILTIRARQRDFIAQNSILQIQIKERELERENERRIEKERFLSMLTHELRNPLGVIRLMTSSASLSDKAVQKAALDMTQIIERVEQSDALEEQRYSVRKTNVNLPLFFQNSVREHSAHSRVRATIPPDINIVTDPELLQRIVRNMLDNADKYSQPDSLIDVSATPCSHNGRNGFSIIFKNKIGQAGAPNPERLFTKYYRSKGAHRQPGSGLGLFLVAGWCEALDGRVEYASHQDQPIVEFKIWLPQ